MILYIATSPVAVPANSELKKESSETELARYEKIANLTPRKRLAFSHFSIPQKIQAIGQKYGFELLRLANITRLIREYYFGEVRFEDFPAEIEKRVGVSLLTAQEITRRVKSEIIDWDPWAEYIAKLPKMSAREMFEKKLKIADTEITSGYVELRDSEDLEDPTIKNWIQDYISHLGYGQHSQMDRTQYLFHSENGKSLSSLDREKLGIILRSFDENIPLPVDEENGEIVFDGLIEKTSPQPSPYQGEGVAQPLQPTPDRKESFIKPYKSASAPQRPTSPQPSPYKGEGARPAPAPVHSTPPQNFVRPNPAPQPQPLTQTPPAAKIQYKATTSDPEIDKYFNTHETSEIPEIKIHSMTEHNEPKPAPQPTIQRLAPPQPETRPKYKIIDPFEPRIGEPKLDGNVVDLSRIEN